MHITFACGGTAGHIYPAIAIAQMIEKQYPATSIDFIGTPSGMENAIVGEAGYPLFHISAKGLKRKLSLDNLKVGYLLLKSMHQSKHILLKHKPKLVVGTGGYVCFPVLLAAHKMGIKTAIHESNAIPGLSVKLAARFVDRIWLGTESALAHLKQKDKCVVVGNPLRSSFIKIKKSQARQCYGIRPDECMILSFGGSLGAEKINEVMIELMRRPLDRRIRIFHICGKSHYPTYQDISFGGRHTLLPYTDDMPTLMSGADIVVCRAGAMTLSEVSACENVPILIPSPNVTGNHQYYNAKALSDNGAAILLEEKDLFADELEHLILGLLASPARMLQIKAQLLSQKRLFSSQILQDELSRLLS